MQTGQWTVFPCNFPAPNQACLEVQQYNAWKFPPKCSGWHLWMKMQAEHPCHKHPSPLVLAEGDDLQLLLDLYGYGTLHGTGGDLLPLTGHIVLLLLPDQMPWWKPWCRSHTWRVSSLCLCSWSLSGTCSWRLCLIYITEGYPPLLAPWALTCFKSGAWMNNLLHTLQL